MLWGPCVLTVNQRADCQPLILRGASDKSPRSSIARSQTWSEKRQNRLLAVAAARRLSTSGFEQRQTCARHRQGSSLRHRNSPQAVSDTQRHVGYGPTTHTSNRPKACTKQLRVRGRVPLPPSAASNERHVDANQVWLSLSIVQGLHIEAAITVHYDRWWPLPLELWFLRPYIELLSLFWQSHSR